MSTVAVFATDVVEKDDSANERPIGRLERIVRPRLLGVESDATGITFLEDRTEWLIAAHKKLARLASLNADWDSYGAEVPNQESIDAARNVLRFLAEADFEPTSIDPSVEGGVCLSFQHGGRYGDIECFNCGEILAVISTGGDDTTAWDIRAAGQHLHGTLSRIRTFIAR